jgi:sugar lactone lactonase YvrE
LETVSYGKSARKTPGDWALCCPTLRTANVFIKDQVTPMLFRKNIVSMRTLFQLAVASVFSVVGVGGAVAAGPNNPPLLVPYTLTTVAGTPQIPTGSVKPVPGYGGDQGAATPYLNSAGKVVPGATLNVPDAVAVDSVGNVYFTDSGNDIIREVNAQTGIINTIAGVPKLSGCADGAPAAGSKIGSGLRGIALDAFGNVYFVDATTSTVSVIYRGGARVAAFISLVNPGAVAAAGGVLPGYLYHIAGTVNVGSPVNSPSASCAATIANNGTTTDNVIAFENSGVPTATPGATLNAPYMISLDSAGNIYIDDNGNSTTRVINTQSTPQTFFQYTVQPGFMRSIVNCNVILTTICPNLTTSTGGTGINGPANAIAYNSQIVDGQSDAYGNVYQLNGTSGTTTAPGIYGAVAYAGGAPLTNLLTAEAAALTPYYGPLGVVNTPPYMSNAELPLTYGNSYIALDNPALTTTLPSYNNGVYAINNTSLDIRPDSLTPDTFGTFWFYDQHYPEIARIDQFTSLATYILGGRRATASTSVTGVPGVNYSTFASFTNPWYCVYGAANAGNAFMSGPQTYDPEGDGCPAVLGYIVISSRDNIVADGPGNVYLTSSQWNLVKELPIGTAFPATPLTSSTAPAPVTQAIQIHFDATNIPVVSVAQVPNVCNSCYTSTSFKIASGTSDFTINTTTPEFPMGSLGPSAYGNTPKTTNFGLYPTSGQTGLPTCAQLGIGATPVDKSYDCLVYVTFNPVAPGLRQGDLMVTTANGSVYNFQLTGVGNGGQLAIDGGQQMAVQPNGLGANPTGIAVNAAGVQYITDPANNRIVVCTPGGGTLCATQTAIGPTISGVTPGTLSGPMGVALDAANNIYISDTGNNRVLEVNAGTGIATQLGNYLWIPGSTCVGNSGTPAADCPVATAGGSNSVATFTLANQPGASVTPTTAPPQYQFNAPQGLAVDTWGNVYVADTGNAAVVEIPSNTALGGAAPMLQYTGAPTFTTPVGVAVDSKGNVYVADEGNPAGEIVRIPPGGGDLQPLSLNPSGSALFLNLPLLGGQGISVPNGVAVDAAGDVYVSDSGTNTIWEAPAAGPPNGNPFTLNFTGLSTPAGLALDASGNLYVVDSGNSRILFDNRQNPTASFGTVPQDLSGPSGIAGTPAGCPVAGSGQPCSGVLTVTNVGNQAIALTSPFLTTSGASPAGNTAYAVTSNCSTLYANGSLPAGDTCTISPTFSPTSDGSQTESINVNGTQSVALVASTQGTGEQPLVNIVLTSSVGLSPATGSNATITATVTQPHTPPGGIPTGTVTFTYVIDAGTANAGLCGAGGSQTVPLNAAGIATYTLPALAQGLVYTVNATYNGDSLNSLTSATPIVLTVPGIPETVVANSVSYIYGQAVPAITGTVTPAPASGVTFSFTSGASQYSNVPTTPFPVQVVFKGGNFCSYGFPAAVTSGGAPATVTENKAPLTVTVPAYSTVYGAATFNYASQMVITGAVGNDLKKLSATFTPADSSVLDVNIYPVVATLTGKPFGNYNVTYAGASTDTVTAAPSGITVSAAATSELPANVTKGVYTITVNTLVPAGKGVASGTVTVTDNFVPITSTFYLTGSLLPAPANESACSSTVLTNCYTPTCSTTITANCYTLPCTATSTGPCYMPPCTGTATSNCTAPISVPLVAGTGTFNLPASLSAIGIHNFSFTYSGDAGSNGDGKGDFQCSVYGQAAVGSCATTGTAPLQFVVDYPDFNITSTTLQINVQPGVTPSGNALPAAPGQNTAIPESGTLQLNAVLGLTSPQINVSCTTDHPSYVSCFMTPTLACLTSSTSTVCPSQSGTVTATTIVLAVSTPVQLPLGFNTSEVRTSATKTVLAFLPFGVLAFCVRRRRMLSKALWVLIAIAAVSVGASGCGGNSVALYTPVPPGVQNVVVNVSSSAAGSNGVTRSYTIPINIF